MGRPKGRTGDVHGLRKTGDPPRSAAAVLSMQAVAQRARQRGERALAFDVARLRIFQRDFSEAYRLAGAALCKARQIDCGDMSDSWIAAGRRRLGHQHDGLAGGWKLDDARHDTFGNQFERRRERQSRTVEPVADTIGLRADVKGLREQRALRGCFEPIEMCAANSRDRNARIGIEPGSRIDRPFRGDDVRAVLALARNSAEKTGVRDVSICKNGNVQPGSG